MIGETERILVCCGKGCAGNGAQEVASAIEEELVKRGYDSASSVKVVRTGCAGECDQGPIVRLMPNDITYYRVSTKHAAAIVDSLSGEPVKKLVFKKKRQYYEKLTDNPFYGLQYRVALQYLGVVNPLSFEDYTAYGGYNRLKTAWTMAPIAVHEKLQNSGLRLKRSNPESPATAWLETSHQAPTQIVCSINSNGFDDPVGIALAEGSPHAIIEGMTLAMHAFQACEGIFIMKSKDETACNTMRRAIEDVLASEILTSTAKELGQAITLTVEEEADYPYKDAAPTNALLSIDAETLAVLPFAIGNALESSSSTSDNFRETKVFALDGKAKHIGLVEVPTGTSLRTLVFKVGGGIAGDRPLKAIRIGSPAGIYISESAMGMPIDFDSFAQHGIAMDAGSISVLDDRTCIVKTTRNALRKLNAQTASTNLAYGEHLRKAIALLEQLCVGDGEPGDADLLSQIGLSMHAAATTRSERSGADCLLSSIEHFRSEYDAHAREKRCPAGSCPKLTQFVISPEACAGCDACSDACPSEAITGEQRQPHAIDYDKCVSCGTCRDVCRFHAILTERKPLTE